MCPSVIVMAFTAPAGVGLNGRGGPFDMPVNVAQAGRRGKGTAYSLRNPGPDRARGAVPRVSRATISACARHKVAFVSVGVQRRGNSVDVLLLWTRTRHLGVYSEVERQGHDSTNITECTCYTDVTVSPLDFCPHARL